MLSEPFFISIITFHQTQTIKNNSDLPQPLKISHPKEQQKQTKPQLFCCSCWNTAKGSAEGKCTDSGMNSGALISTWARNCPLGREMHKVLWSLLDPGTFHVKGAHGGANRSTKHLLRTNARGCYAGRDFLRAWGKLHWGFLTRFFLLKHVNKAHFPNCCFKCDHEWLAVLQLRIESVSNFCH